MKNRIITECNVLLLQKLQNDYILYIKKIVYPITRKRKKNIWFLYMGLIGEKIEVLKFCIASRMVDAFSRLQTV